MFEAIDSPWLVPFDGSFRTADMPTAVDEVPDKKSYKKKLEGLAELNKKYGIVGAYQNHSGRYFGSPVWDLWMQIKDMDPEYTGCQYDIRHAVMEGANSWVLGLQLLKPFSYSNLPSEVLLTFNISLLN